MIMVIKLQGIIILLLIIQIEIPGKKIAHKLNIILTLINNLISELYFNTKNKLLLI
jgi:hypothetical protein